MKKSIVFVVLLCIVLMFCACGRKAKEEVPIVRIGVFEPSSGDYASVGQKEILGIQYANMECPNIEIGGKTYEVQLIITDNESSKETAADVAMELIDAGAAVILGSYGAELSGAGAPVFEEAGVAAIGVTYYEPSVTLGNSYYYSISFHNSFYAAILASFAVDRLNAKTAYCLGVSGSPNDVELITSFTQLFEAAGGKVVTDYFSANSMDFTGYLNKAVMEEAELILVPSSASCAAQIVTQANELDMEVPILGADWVDDSQVLSAAAGSNIQLYIATPYVNGISPQFDEGFQKYIEDNSEAKVANGDSDEISSVTAMGYDAYYLAIRAMKLAKSVDKADILAKMPAVTSSGICGDISFDPDGDALRSTAFIKASDNSNGIWVFERTQSVKND